MPEWQNIAKEKRFIYKGGHLPYDPSLIEKARELRKQMPEAERKLWYKYLSCKTPRFLRQKPVDRYIVDFYCYKLQLVIELDGESHETNRAKTYDDQRTEILERYGLTVLRIHNEEILYNFENVCEVIGAYID